MIVELHLLQNFAPANLNRDDTGSPKDCEFGGYRRARISSQAQKRAIRDLFVGNELIPEANRGQRTARLVEAVSTRLAERGRDSELSRQVSSAVIGALGIKMNDKRPEETSYLVFAGSDEINALADIGDGQWDALVSALTSATQSKKKFELPREVAAEAKRAIDGKKAVDVALFGRMLANLPDNNQRRAASQVAHALSVNRVSMEFDFFTAVDDLKDASLREEDAGAGMLGTIEFNSSCFYRYLNVDVDQLLANLAGDRGLAETTVRAYLTAAIMAIPTGKQNTTPRHDMLGLPHLR
jgi:CRISPR system Cascade subunit CasC